jgi:hypothetical protein
MNGPILDLENVIGIVVQPMLFQKCIEICQVVPIEQRHTFTMRGNLTRGFLSADGNRRDHQSHTQAGKAKYRFQHARTPVFSR